MRCAQDTCGAGAGRRALHPQRLQDLDQQRRHRRDHDRVRADARREGRQDCR